MPIRVEDHSWFSAIRADDKLVYLNSEGAIKTGKNLKGRLVSIAESLGIFKGYVADYRRREVRHNRDAYNAAWRFVNLKYGSVVKSHTQKSMKNKGYARADSQIYIQRLRGHSTHDPRRAVVGRELRLILDTARGIDQTMQEKVDIERPQHTEPTVRRDVEIAAQKQRWAAWTGARQSTAEVVTQGSTETEETVAAPESTGNADGMAESLRDPEMSVGGLDGVADASTPESRIDEDGSKPALVHRELGRAMVAGNKELLRQTLGGETQLRELAQELGYDPEPIVSRRNYIQGKLEKRLETDPRAHSRKLNPNEMRELTRSVFDKALGKSTMVAGVRGAMLGTASKVKRALDEDNPAQVDVLKLSKDKIKVAAGDMKYLKKLMVERFGAQNQEISAGRMGYIEQLAIKAATALVQEYRVELSAREVDDVLASSLLRSFEVRESRAWLEGELGKVAGTVKPQPYGYKRSAADVLEKATNEQPHAPVEATDVQAKVPHEAQRQPEQLGQTSSPPGKEPVTSPPPHQDSPESAAVATPSPASIQPEPLPKPEKYQGVDYFDQSDREIRRLDIPVRNHQAAKQVAVDNRYLVASVPEGHSGGELTSAHREYIKTILLRHVSEHERTRPGVLLDAGDLHRMMMPITARALKIQSDRKLGAKVLYKNVTKHLGRKDAAFGDAMKKLRREARSKAAAKVSLPSFVQGAARKANIAIDANSTVLRDIRPQVKDMAETYVNKHRKALTEPVLEHFVQVCLRGYSRAERMGLTSPARGNHWKGYSRAERMGLVR